MNPLLNSNDLPAFHQILPEHISPALDVLLENANKALQKVTAPEFPANWDAIAQTFAVASEHLGTAWGAVSHLHAVMDTTDIRAAYNAALPRVIEFSTRVGADEALYAKYKAIEISQLNDEQKRALDLAKRGFVLSGADLKGAEKERFAQIQERLATLGQKFSENVLDATDAFTYLASENEIQGIPKDICEAARNAAEEKGQKGYLLTLKMPCYLPVMQFAENRALRQKLYTAYTTRASNLGASQFDNTDLINEILALRSEEAQLLGFRHFADASLATKMAQSPEQVIAFLRDLAQKARVFAQKDVLDLRVFAAEHLGFDVEGDSSPQPWDWSFISEKLKEARYAFSEQEVKQYFTAPRVLEGLFKIIETLFDVQIKKDEAPIWHKDVVFYRLERNQQLIGQFYLDQSARTGKRSGAWMDDARGRWLRPDSKTLQTPVAHLVCNFASGVNGQPALLTHDDVITLFHEFGHGLHHLLTKVNERDVSGISGVEWDAVELPSQFMENFCWEWNVIEHLTAHVETNEPLPRSLFNKMLAAKNFQSGLQTLRQIEFALFDMLLHSQHQPKDDFMQLLDQVRQEVAVLPTPAFNRAMHTFSHIFAGGYAAGYYSYKWAEVLSADVYQAFEEAAQTKALETAWKQTGKHLRETIFEVGGSRKAMESFQAFRGREPRLDALLEHQGMK